MNKFKVLIRCVTFNHAPYITATMDGFCRQQTDFPFVCVILDDASTDGEQEVIRQYLKENFREAPQPPKGGEAAHPGGSSPFRGLGSSGGFFRHRANPNCYFAVYLLKENHYSAKKSKEGYYQELLDGVDYVALCEGDDYWTDARKLQRQADALDATPQAMLAFTNFRLIDSEDKPISNRFIDTFASRSHTGDNLPTLLHHGNYVMTLTTMYRREVWQSEMLAKCPYQMDFALTMAAALMGDFIWMPEQTACYHSLQSGQIMSNHPKVIQMTKDIYRYYAGLLMRMPPRPLKEEIPAECAVTVKPLSFRQRVNVTTLILLWALRIKDTQLKKDTLKASLLAYLLLPVAYVRLKCERLRDRLK
jgi:glycosyltransferase involved in cell wall biosynthesis